MFRELFREGPNIHSPPKKNPPIFMFGGLTEINFPPEIPQIQIFWFGGKIISPWTTSGTPRTCSGGIPGVGHPPDIHNIMFHQERIKLYSLFSPDFTSLGFLPLGQLLSHCNYANYLIHNGCTICPLFGTRYQGLNQGFMTSVYKTC